MDVDDDEAARALEWEACIGSVAACNLGEVSPVSVTGVNVYDVRVPCGDSKLCYDFSAIDAYMNQPDVQAALGVSFYLLAIISPQNPYNAVEPKATLRTPLPPFGIELHFHSFISL